ncbi:hypothetical protein [Micromonospora sp. AMSO31t]|uniref:hypothetical protein n=1 Tax=Micromonospora sp. AMSO31t TaxID=2650566 RepID=UPI00124B7EDD|nr:hypothetical protein [Micromonospora sp. AMSO31t]
MSTVLVAVLGATAALSVAAGPAQAASARSTATVADRLVLEPTDRGYRGSLTVDLTYRGTEPGRATYVITEPIPGSYENVEWGISCYSSGDVLPDYRTRVECDVPGGELAPGERRSFTLDFRVLTSLQPHAMKAGNGRLAVKVGGEVVADEAFSTRFRSTTGTLADPQPYVQDTQPDVSVSITGGLTLARRPDGFFEGRLPVTVRYNGDAPHDQVWFEPVSLPDGIWEPWTEECGLNCVPGGAFMEGEERTFTLIFSTASELAAGDLGEGSIAFRALSRYPNDLNPADNVITFPVTVTGAA